MQTVSLTLDFAAHPGLSRSRKPTNQNLLFSNFIMATSNSASQCRRPALIPADAHLSAEDEESLLRRIGAVQLTTPRTYASHRPQHRTKSAIGPANYDASIRAQQGAANNAGTKRKASTSSEQLRLRSLGLGHSEEEAQTLDTSADIDAMLEVYQKQAEATTATHSHQSNRQALNDDVEQVSPKSSIACMGRKNSYAEQGLQFQRR